MGSPKTITATGTGIATASPDTLSINIGVETRSGTASEALSANNESMTKVLQTLKDGGIDDKDLQTSNLSVWPNFDNKGVITDYVVSNQLTATVRKFDSKTAGELIDKAASVAGDTIRVNGINFYIEDTTTLTEQARTSAVKRAREQADQMAEAAGVKVGKVRMIVENPGSGVSIPYPSASRAVFTDSSVPLSAGSQQVSVAVQVVFELDR